MPGKYNFEMHPTTYNCVADFNKKDFKKVQINSTLRTEDQQERE
jgi:hypothetical protein